MKTEVEQAIGTITSIAQGIEDSGHDVYSKKEVIAIVNKIFRTIKTAVADDEAIKDSLEYEEIISYALEDRHDDEDDMLNIIVALGRVQHNYTQILIEANKKNKA